MDLKSEQYESGYEIYFSRSGMRKYLLCEKNYTGQQLDSITELKTKNYEEKCYRRPTKAEQLMTS